MRIWIVSDLHCDSSLWSPAAVPAHDVLVIAGDVANGREAAIANLYRIAHHTMAPIVFVPGNHDVFDGTLDGFVGSDRLRDDGIHVLEPGAAVVIAGVRFIGATLWTDWQIRDQEFQAQAWAARHMPEYAHVTRADADLIWPVDVFNEHQRHRRAIDEALAVPHAGPTVVVTHHAPSIRSVHPGDRTDVSAAAFASDLEELILRHQPSMWVHGHIHHGVDYRVGATRVVCNPRGYVGAEWSERTGWDENIVIHIPSTIICRRSELRELPGTAMDL
jgi:Icc-related predicted phosphoesterase